MFLFLLIFIQIKIGNFLAKLSNFFQRNNITNIKLGVYDLFKGREIDRLNRILIFTNKSKNENKENKENKEK